MEINFDEEATSLAKEIIFNWQDFHDFNNIVNILKDYLVDQNSAYNDALAKIKG